MYLVLMFCIYHHQRAIHAMDAVTTQIHSSIWHPTNMQYSCKLDFRICHVLCMLFRCCTDTKYKVNCSREFFFITNGCAILIILMASQCSAYLVTHTLTHTATNGKLLFNMCFHVICR